MTTLTPDGVYKQLIDKDRILTINGQIRFYLGDVDIVVRQKDVVGNIIQEWLEGWLEKRGIMFAGNPNTQMPPDIFLNPDNRTSDLLEVKAFNFKASPGFDIADFKSYEREIIEKPYMLHTKYLIFGYVMTEEGYVAIKRLWLKNVWEICRTSEHWAVNVQYKNKVVHKIRPATWYSKSKAIRYKTFECLEDFLAAIEDTVYSNPDTRGDAVGWKRRMEESYRGFYGKGITIPRWMDVAGKYSAKDE